MSRELAGVIACLQEIEIALRPLKARPDLLWHHAIPEIEERLLRFFRGASVDRAREVELFLRNLDADYRKKDGGTSILNEQVLVDGISTSLSGLAQELREVIEDLEG